MTIDSVQFDPDTLAADKRRFAVALSKAPERNAFIAGNATFPDNVALAMKAAMQWPSDPAVMAYKAEDDEADMPTKKDVVRMLMKPFISRDEVEAIKELNKMLGYVQKEAAVVVNNNKVMVIREAASDEAWQQKAERQQAELLAANATRH